MLKQLRNVVRAATSSDPLHKYKLDEASAIKGGRHNLFTIYRAVERSTQNEVSVFMVLLKDLRARCANEAEVSRVMSQVREGVALLARLRHDSILQVVRPLTEDSKRAWFVTERVVDHVPQLPLSEMPAQVKLIELRRCAVAMRFVHEQTDTLLVNFSPHALYVTAAGPWKLGDFMHALPRTQLDTVTLPSSFRALDAPLLDYMPYEYVDYAMKQSGHGGGAGSRGGASPSTDRRGDQGHPHPHTPHTHTHRYGSCRSNDSDDINHNNKDYRHGGSSDGVALDSLLSSTAHVPADMMSSLFDLAGSSSALVFPDSDSYALVITTVEIITGKRLFQCVGQLSQHPGQRRSAETAVAQHFNATVLQLPRPPVSVILTSGAYNTTDVQLLVALEGYSVMDEAEQFGTLRGVYNGVNGGLFCELAVIRYIIPVIMHVGAAGGGRAGTDVSRLRYTLPVLLQCCATLTSQSFNTHMRDYIVSLITAVTKTTAFETVEVLAQQMVEKMTSLRRHMHSGLDNNDIFIPFLVKCLSCSSNVVLLRLSLEMLQSLLQLRSAAAGGLALPVHLAETLVRIAMKAPHLFSRSVDCLELVLPVSSLAVKQSSEGQLLGVLDVLAAAEASEPSARRVMQLLRQLEKELPLEHVANQSIPRRSVLLVSTHPSVRQFAVSTIMDCVRRFDETTESAAKDGGAPGTSDKQAPLPWWPSSSASVSQSLMGGGGGGGLSTAMTHANTTSTTLLNNDNDNNNNNNKMDGNNSSNHGNMAPNMFADHVMVTAAVGSHTSSPSSLTSTPPLAWERSKKIDFASVPPLPTMSWGPEMCATVTAPDVVNIMSVDKNGPNGNYDTIHVDCTSAPSMWSQEKTSVPAATTKDDDDLFVGFSFT